MSPPLVFPQHAMEDCIIYSLDHDSPSSPPRSLLPLMLTCRLFYNLLRPSNNPHLYRRIFYRKFDLAAIARRFPSSCVVVSRFYPELKKRFLALRCIKLGDIHHPRLEDAFLAAYIMLLEHDALNHRHLVDAGLPALLDNYITERLHRGPNDWPTEDTCNVLAVALFWHMTSQDALNGESNDSRNKLMDILLPLTFAWFRYSFIEQGFDPFAFVNGGSSSSCLSSPAHSPVHPSPVTIPIDYMGHAFCLQLPAIALSASLAYFARLDAFPLVPPPCRAPSREQSQSQSQSQGQLQIDEWTVEDIELYNSSFRTRTIPRGPGCPDSPSTCHDWDWLRAVAGDPFMSGSLRRYTPGILTGKWRGTELAPYSSDFTRFMTREAGPSELPGQSRIPFSCSLEEHVRYGDPCHKPLFPSTSWTRKEGGMELIDERSSAEVFYGQQPEKVQRGTKLGATADQEIVDVILSGRTELHLQPAWEFSGRVRISDGLVVLVRQPLHGRLPRRSIYVGYLLSSQNFVGKWKYCNPGAQWEGIWSLCKVNKSHVAHVPPLAGGTLRLASGQLAPFRLRAGALTAPARDPISYQSSSSPTSGHHVSRYGTGTRL